MEQRLRILIGKAGLDGHDRGAKIIARALRDAGMEVIYTGLHQSVSSIVQSAIQEDVNAIGISILSGAHMTIFPEIIRQLKEKDASDIVVFGGGIIPDDDREALLAQGIKELFSPGTSTELIVKWVRENVVTQ
jgi:methylmalonyl-CoA mutase C-terminal domain/subunit